MSLKFSFSRCREGAGTGYFKPLNIQAQTYMNASRMRGKRMENVEIREEPKPKQGVILRGESRRKG